MITTTNLSGKAGEAPAERYMAELLLVVGSANLWAPLPVSYLPPRGAQVVESIPPQTLDLDEMTNA
jgi:hypothetical protein